jgi:transposase-like protein
MPKPCSQDLRERVLEAVEAGASRREAAENYGISASSAIKWMQRWHASGQAERGKRVAVGETCAMAAGAGRAIHVGTSRRWPMPAQVPQPRVNRTKPSFSGSIEADPIQTFPIFSGRRPRRLMRDFSQLSKR